MPEERGKKEKKEKGKISKSEPEAPSEEIVEETKKKEKPLKKTEKASETGGNKNKESKKSKKAKNEEEAEEPDESEVIVSPDGQKFVSKPLPPSLSDTATMMQGLATKHAKPGEKPAGPEKPVKKEKERIPIDPSQVHVHEVSIPEDLKKYQRGCLLKIRKVGNSRFSQEMTRCANQLFIKKLGRGQYFVPDYYILSEIQAWAKKWETTLEFMPLDDEIRQAHLVDVKSKMSATGEDLPKKVKDLTRDLKLRDDQLIKIQMTGDEEKANLTAEIENLHNQLDQSELRIADLEAKQDDTETGSGAAEIAILRERVKSLEDENGQLRVDADGLRKQIAELKKSPLKAPKAAITIEETEPAPIVEPEKPAAKVKPTAKAVAAGKVEAAAAIVEEPEELPVMVTPAGKAKPAANEKPAEKEKLAPKAKPAKGKKKVVEEVTEEEIPIEDAKELEGVSDLLEQPEQPEPEEEEEPVDEAELAKALAYKKPKWDDDDTTVEVQEDENAEMTDEELEEFEKEQKKRESGEADEDSGADSDGDTDEE